VKSSKKSRANGRPAPRREILASEVLERAAHLFAERGFAGTNLKDVADAVGLSRSAIYYYFPSKEALLEELVQGVTLPAARVFDTVRARADLTAIERVRHAVHSLVLWVSERQKLFKLMDRSETELPPEIAKRHREAKRRVLSGMIDLVEDAISAGEANPVDARIVAFSFIGMCNWTAWWFNPSHDGTAAELADKIADLAFASIRRSDGQKRGADIPVLVREIQQNLALIQRMSTERRN
jgi:AcrR family transcriptional regulator